MLEASILLRSTGMIAYPVVNGRLDWGSGYYVDSILRRIELERLARTGDIGTAESKTAFWTQGAAAA